MQCFLLKRTLLFFFPCTSSFLLPSFQLPEPEQGDEEWKYSRTTNLFQAFQCQIALSDKPLILCCIQLREVAHGIDGNEPVLSVWRSRETEGYWKEGLYYGSCRKWEGIGVFSRMHWVLFVLYCSVFSSADSILLHWNHLSNFSAYETQMQLIAAAWQKPENPGSRVGAKQRLRSLRLLCWTQLGFFNLDLVSTWWHWLQAKWCRHWLSQDVRPAVCFPVLVRGFLGSPISAPPVLHPLGWRFQEETSAKSCENFICLLPEQQ